MGLVVRLSLEALAGAGCTTSSESTLVDQESVYLPVEVDDVFGRVNVPVTTGSPFDVPMTPVARVKVLFLEGTSPMVALLTSAAGTTQRVPFDGPTILVTQNAPLTAIRIEGNGAFQYIVGGDPS